MPTSSGKIRKSTNPITGIINVTGEPDSGKTSFAMSSGAQPERTAFIDDDVKGASIVNLVEQQGRKFGYYRNLTKETKGMREIDLHKHCMKILDELERMKGSFDVLVWDTFTRFENTFHPMVVSNPAQFRQFYSPMGQIKGAEQWNASFEYEAAVLSAMTDLAPLIILTSHLKKDASKRDVAEGKKPLVQKSRMRVYLRHSADSAEPTGLMLKRLGKMDIENHGMVPVNVTYRKVHPFNWKRLLDYWENPVGNDEPDDPNLKLTEFELSILDGILTRDQKNVLALAVIEAEREREEEARNAREQQRLLKKKKDAIDSPVKLLTKAMSDLNLDGDQVAEILGKKSVDVVMKIKGEEELKEAWKTLEAYEVE